MTSRMPRGHSGDVGAGLQADRVQHRSPGRAPRLQRGHYRVRPARHHLVLALTRPNVWQKARSAHLPASGRSHGETSTANTDRPSAALGSGIPARARRSRAASIRPRLSPPHRAPCPRRCSGASARSTSVRTGPSVHSRAPHNSNKASPRAVRHVYSSETLIKFEPRSTLDLKRQAQGLLAPLVAVDASKGAAWQRRLNSGELRRTGRPHRTFPDLLQPALRERRPRCKLPRLHSVPGARAVAWPAADSHPLWPSP